ncbi:MAG TPA: hypothetical protein PLF32_00815 [Bacteroidales bacterium]|jgi:hypothetical protein|nr:hypothetical protein [Bacteroidales bacterium]HOF15718.1 hypothetical protein [Bacteroidales bacterium]HON21183.1 hypothetical protein [Bacteroidales bacterium]HOR81179.1 hypothetical protein [Bacteroidales bacterium]HPJ90446.1 hypothetical protein [Bacteroidales bacterium]
MEKFRRDSMWLGIVIGIVLPTVLFSLLFGLSKIFAPEGKEYLVKLSTILLISIFPNLFSLRYYLVKLKYDRTGRGILLVTFLFAIAYFLIFLNLIK